MSISSLIALCCGISLFLFGMTLMGDGLKRISGNRLGPVLFRLSGTQWKGILLGTGVTAVIQSSSATSVMVVGFVNSGMMKPRQAISVILGAILGTSITGWIICLSYLDSAAGWISLLSTATLTGVIAVAGILLRVFSKQQVHHQLGDILMGFAVLMVGMSQMSDSVGNLGSQPWFTGLIATLTHPAMGILFGFVFSAMLQSASAAVGILQALSITGVMTMQAALPLLMGICIGASLPVLLSALGANTEGKRTALSYLVASFAGVMVCAALFYIAHAMFHFDFLCQSMNPFSIAAINTILRLAILCVLCPFTDVLEATAALLIPSKASSSQPGVRLEERFLSHPALAVEQSRLTMNDMAAHADEAVRDAIGLLTHYTDEGYQHVKELENEGDSFEDALGTYLVKMTGQELTERQTQLVSLSLHTISDFERITDHALNIARSADEMHEKQLSFSDDAAAELSVMNQAIQEIMHLAVGALIHEDEAMAGKVEPLQEVIDELCEQMKLRHVERLQEGKCTIAHGFILNDLITNFQRIGAHCSNIAVAMIELGSGSLEVHEYLGSIRRAHAPNYENDRRDFQKKYQL
ncbi:MAG: Na/Pi cotransporter family protein [Clostridia bacterium]|nr:Na/Pi cotransporter family protein [Clostridia bacterium]MBQ9212155.1 Na/Pi cotransporter family protein [Clostridia bacterium]